MDIDDDVILIHIIYFDTDLCAFADIQVVRITILLPSVGMRYT